MAIIQFNLPDDWIGRVLDAYKAVFSYQAEIRNPAFDPAQPPDPQTNPYMIPNPETPAVFARRMIGTQIRSVVKQYEAEVAARNAREAKANEIEQDLTID